MLCFAAWGQAIFTGAPRWFAQLRPADPTRQAAIGDLNTIRGEQLLGANGVAARLGEGRCDPFAACVRLSRDTSFARYLRWRFGWRRICRTVLRASLSSRLISRRLWPCAFNTCTLEQISVDIIGD